jgi:hypothetical protein
MGKVGVELPLKIIVSVESFDMSTEFFLGHRFKFFLAEDLRLLSC